MLYINYIFTFLLCSVAVVAGLVALRSKGTVRILGWYLLFVGILQSVASLLFFANYSNLYLYLISIPFSFLIIGWIFYSMQYRRTQRLFVIMLYTTGLIFLLVRAVFGGFTFATLGSLLLIYNVIVVVTTLFTFYGMMQHPDETPLFHQSKFWIVSGFFFYFLCSVAYWFLDYLFPELTRKLGILNTALVLCFYLVLSIGVWVDFKKLN